MSLDIYVHAIAPTKVFEANVTHNLSRMADAVGLYKPLWRPEELGITKAGDLIEPLSEGLRLLKADPERCKKYNPKNGWGTYEEFVVVVERYLLACMQHPDGEVSVNR